MKNILKTLLGITLIFMFGCVSVQIDESMFDDVLNCSLIATKSELEKVVFGVSWFYRKNQRWPNSKQELINFATLNKAPLDLSNYLTLTFHENEEKNLDCKFIIKEDCEQSKNYLFADDKRNENGCISGETKGSIEITKEQVLNLERVE